MALSKSTRTWCPSPLSKDVSSNGRMAAAESVRRRAQAVAFINKLTETSLRLDISEVQLQDSLRDGVTLCNVLNKILTESEQAAVKVVEICKDSATESHAGCLATENISTFLTTAKAINPELKLFEASDFDEKGYGSDSTARIVDCILDLELWYSQRCCEEPQSPASWRRQHPALLNPSPFDKTAQLADNVDEDESHFSIGNTDPGHTQGMDGDISGLARMMLSSPRAFQSPRSLFASHLQMNNTPPCSPMSDIVGNVLGSAKVADMDGIARRLEIFVETCKQEFENLRYVKDEQMLKLKEALMDALKSDEMHQSRGRMLEALIEGQGEEVQVVSEQLQQAQEEQMKVSRERRRLKEELVRTKRELDTTRLRLAEMEQEGPRQTAAWKEQEAKRHRQLLRAATELQEVKRAFTNTKVEVHRAEESWSSHLRSLEGQMAELVQVTEGYQRVLEENRRLYNEVQDLKGNIRVYCRVRPLHDHESDRPSCIEFLNSNGDIMIGSSVKPNSRRGFTFDKVFGPGTSQEAIFADTRPLIRSVLDGFNVCIFAYGQTGSGKTFTMAGPNDPKEADWGVNVRALNDLFGLGKERVQTMKYEVGVQMVEIYNEQVRDLLDSSGNGPRSLEIRNNSQVDGLNVPDATKVPVCSTGDVLRLMDLGMRNRAVACTSLNERSSRSHSVLTVHVQGLDAMSGAILRGCLHLVDLAGSERIDRSEATGDRLKEAQHINKSLSALGDVVAALANKSPHIPYRNSKLTQLLQDALGKQAKTLMFVHVSPDEESYGETVSTLTFAKRVASVELGASSRNSESAELRESREKIANLKDELLRKTAEVEKAQQLRAEAVSRANALAAAAASAALPGRPAPDRRLSESGVAKRTLTLTEDEPEKTVRTKRLSDAMMAITEETEAPCENRASTRRFTRSRGLPPTIPGVRKTLARRNSIKSGSKSMEALSSGGALTRAAAAAGESMSGVPPQKKMWEGVLEEAEQANQDEGGGFGRAADVFPDSLRDSGGGGPSDGDGLKLHLGSDSRYTVERPPSPGHGPAAFQEPAAINQVTFNPTADQELEERSTEAPVPLPAGAETGQPNVPPADGNEIAPSEKRLHLRSASHGNAPPHQLLEPLPTSPVCTPRAKDPLRVSFKDFNLPQEPTRQEPRQKKGDGRSVKHRLEKENEEEDATPALLPGGASPVGKGSLFEKQSVASRLRLATTSSTGDSASKLPTPRRLTMAGTSIPLAPGRPTNHRRSSSVEDALAVPGSAIPAPPSRLKLPGVAVTASGGTPRAGSRRQWV